MMRGMFSFLIQTRPGKHQVKREHWGLMPQEPDWIHARQPHEQQHTVVRVDTCSKHLLAAPLKVQNDEAWKFKRFGRKTTLQRSLRSANGGRV